MKKLFIVANWKMNGNKRSNEQLINCINDKVCENANIEVVICQPFTYLTQILKLKTSSIKIGAQNISERQNGAFTGEISGPMLQDLKVDYVIIGHSERRQMYNDTNAVIAQKFELAHQNNLIPILCIGESLNERKTGQTLSVIESQIKYVIETTRIELFAKSIIAYEPVWAIGTGVTATPQQAQDTHAFIRRLLAEHDSDIAQTTPILYGGSMNPVNAEELIGCEDIDGGLIGGASLKSDDFLHICKAG